MLEHASLKQCRSARRAVAAQSQDAAAVSTMKGYMHSTYCFNIEAQCLLTGSYPASLGRCSPLVNKTAVREPCRARATPCNSTSPTVDKKQEQCIDGTSVNSFICGSQAYVCFTQGTSPRIQQFSGQKQAPYRILCMCFL